ncbi:MAG: serine/threonine protein kinase [Deltaproteobacteria bacterium]|nr:serine/threonine protein kinase [Deltaproteobacteria bacterium]
MRCLDDDIVLGLIEGRLAVPILADVDDHLDRCPTCRDVVAQVARVQAPSHVLPRGHALGRYVIGDLLGTGAMGRVYSAWEPELDRRVALKVLVADGDGARERIVREAQAMAKLDHPNVVGVHEVGTSDDGVFVAMELVDGETLRAWAAQQRTWRQVASVLAEIALGLGAVHAAGVTHRDIKPDNIIVGSDGRTRLGDFGLARSGVAAPIAPATSLVLAAGTPATAIAGTPAYMAPEVLRGSSATAASDQFSFGVMAYEVLAGQRPFTGTSWKELLTTIETGAAPAIRTVPGWLDDLVRRCLAVEPGRRFPSMRAIAELIAAKSVQRSPAVMLGGVLAAAVLASGATLLIVRDKAVAPSCDLAGERALAATWNPAVRERLVSLDGRALAAIDRWATTWRTERVATCRAVTTQPAATIIARDRCLDQRHAELGALLARLEAPGASATAYRARIQDALAALPPPTECAAATTGSADPVPLDPVLAAIVREVLAELPAIRAANALGDSRPVLAVAASLVDRARTSSHAPTLAEALLAQAETLRGASQLADAHVAARDALAAAERGHDDAMAARAWIARVATAGDRRELVVAEDFGAVAAAAVDRAGAPPHLVATLLRLRGLVAYNRGLFTEATLLLTEAHARFVAIAGPRSLDVATIESALGSVARASGDLPAAERWHRNALAIDRDVRGGPHPDIARDLHNVAGVLRLRGDLTGAAAIYREALVIEEAIRGAGSVQGALTRNSLALIHMANLDWTAAREELVRARDLLIAAGHGDAAFAHHNLGLVEAAVGDHLLAMAHYELAAAVYASTIGDRALPAIRLVIDRARSEWRLGHRDALATTMRAQKLAREAGIEWIDQEATQLIALRRGAGFEAVSAVRAKTPSPVEIRTEPPIRGTTTNQPAAAEVPTPPEPPKPQPTRDVGAYGSTQPW